MKRILITTFLISIILVSFSQVQFVGLSSNAQLTGKTKSSLKRSINITDTLSLPFFDDFSYDSLYPSQTHWLDRNVYINDNFAVDPPSIGVATFDVLDQNGLMYSQAGSAPVESDFLTSKPINLSMFSASDSIYFSFYYQAQGISLDAPEETDSLVLQFYVSSEQWKTVWSVAGKELHDFEQVMIPVLDTSYFKNNFQFRFFNFASIVGPENQEDAITTDFWNLDYIVLDSARSAVDTTHMDVAIYRYSNSLFSDYYSTPYQHFKFDLMELDSMSFHYRNLFSELWLYENSSFVLTQNSTQVLDQFEIGGLNIDASSVLNKTYAPSMMSDLDEGYHMPQVLLDSTIFDFVREFKIDPRDSNSNNQVKVRQYFYNYYAYDDGTAETGLAILEAEAKYAFKIKALRKDTLRGLSMFFNRYNDYGTADESVFSLCVWKVDTVTGLPGEIIYQEDNISPQYGSSVNGFSTYKFKQAIDVDSTFYIGFINETPKVYSIGYDLNNTNDNQVFYTIAGVWNSLEIGMPLIRPLMGDDFTVISVPEKDNVESLKVFPNPSRGLVNIEFPEHKTYTVQVYNSSGILLINKIIETGEALDLKPYGTGMYLIRSQDSKQSYINKIVVY